MNRLKELRKKKGLTQSEVAETVGTTQGSLSGWENNRYDIPSEFVGRLCALFDCTPDYLLAEDLVNEDPELTEYLDQLKNRPEMRMLFSLAKSATKSDVEKAVKIIEALFDD